MNKTKRQKLIIKILADSDTALTCRKLAKLLDTSENTIRNDLDDIEGKLRESGAGTVERKPGVGIRTFLILHPGPNSDDRNKCTINYSP